MDSWEGNDQDPQSLHKYIGFHVNPVLNTDPSGRAAREIPSSRQLGNLVEDVVAADFRVQRQNFRLDRSIHTILDRLPGYKGEGRRRPDLVDMDLYEVYDVKSWGEAEEGFAKVQLYVSLLRDSRINPDPNRDRWHAGSTYRMSGPVFRVPGEQKIYAQVYPALLGVVAYRLYEVDSDEDRKRIPVPVTVPSELRREFRQTTLERELRFGPQLAVNIVRFTAIAAGAAITAYVEVKWSEYQANLALTRF